MDDDKFPAECDNAVPEAKVVDLIDVVVETAAVPGCGVGRL